MKRWLWVLVTGLLSGLVAILLMTVVSLTLRLLLGISPVVEAVPDRLAPTIEVNEFLSLLRRYGGYNRLKQLGVGSGLLAQVVAGTLGGMAFAIMVEARAGASRAARRRRGFWFALIGVISVWVVTLIVLWPVLTANFRGLPPSWARPLAIVGLLLTYAVYGVTVVLTYRWIATGQYIRREVGGGGPIPRRAVLALGLGGALALGSGGLLRLLYTRATFSYDGFRNRGVDLTPITPNDRFYLVTKNVIDPRVAKSAWRLQITGAVENPRTYGFDDLASMPSVTQATTLMCISNGVGDSLISNAVWKGVRLRDLIAASVPRPGVVEVVLHGADAYTDTFEFSKALEPTTLAAYAMNDVPIPDRHGFPVRMIVPGKFGEKNVKWVTRVELVTEEVKGFYEQQGWGPDFNIPIRTGFYAPSFSDPLRVGATVTLRGWAFAPTEGVARVEISLDGGRSWQRAQIDDPGTPISWTFWSYAWRPTSAGSFQLIARAVDTRGEMQSARGTSIVPSGARGYHRVTATVEG